MHQVQQPLRPLGRVTRSRLDPSNRAHRRFSDHNYPILPYLLPGARTQEPDLRRVNGRNRRGAGLLHSCFERFAARECLGD
jgi:hypothetical protein